MLRFTPMPLFLLIAVPLLASADVLTVRQDGTGDYSSITAAVAAASANDVVEVGPGTYAEGAAITLSIPLSLISTDGAASTHLDAASQHRVLVLEATGVQVSGFTIQNGNSGLPGAGGGVVAGASSSALIEDCVFEGNVASTGGAIYVTASRTGLVTTMTARRCTFLRNHAADAGGAMAVMVGATGFIEDCYFEENNAVVYGGALFTYQAESHTSNSLFLRNTSGDVAGAICIAEGSGTNVNNTIVDSTSPGTISGSIILLDSPTSIVERNIIVGDTAGYGLRLHGASSATSHACNLFWGNAAGPIGGSPLAADEIVADPGFCDPSAGNYEISSNSPAAPIMSPCGDLLGALPVGCTLSLPGAPRITSILDVPDDNGRQVRIKWDRSEYDAPTQTLAILEYGIYRREPGYVEGAVAPKAQAPDQRQPSVALDGWDFIASVPARGDESYQIVAPTLCNRRIKGGNPHQEECMSYFFVSAMTSDPLVFFDSEADSGYSTDEIPPITLRRLQIHAVSTGMELSWDASNEVDIDAYRVYRGNQVDFDLSEETLVQTLKATRWVDGSPQAIGSFYKVTATDEAGNEGAPAIVAVEGTWLPISFQLHQNNPNPFNPTTQITYDVPRGGGLVELSIFDAAGRRVRTLVQGFQSGGLAKSVEWNGLTDSGAHVASGIYFYRLTAPGFEETRRMTMLQ